jgi:cardiolipin synthase
MDPATRTQSSRLHGIKERLQSWSRTANDAKDRVLNRFFKNTKPGRFIRDHTTADQWSWSRYPLSVLMFVLSVFHRFDWAGMVMLLSGLTDLMDGAIAKAKGTASQKGTKKDTVSDAWEFLCFLCVICFFFGGLVWYIMAFVASVFEVIRLIGGHHFEQRGLATEETYRPNLPGKLKNILYHASGISLLWGIPLLPFVFFGSGILSSFISLQLHWFTYGQLDPKQR